MTEKREACVVPGCECSMDLETKALGSCREHRWEWDANADVDSCAFALTILNPWVEAARAIGDPDLTEVMLVALGELNEKSRGYRAELELAEAAANRPAELKALRDS